MVWQSNSFSLNGGKREIGATGKSLKLYCYTVDHSINFSLLSFQKRKNHNAYVHLTILKAGGVAQVVECLPNI
jgi:hypothetical protein